MNHDLLTFYPVLSLDLHHIKAWFERVAYGLFCDILKLNRKYGLSSHVDYFKCPGQLFRVADGEGLVVVPAVDGELVGGIGPWIIDAYGFEMEEEAVGVVIGGGIKCIYRNCFQIYFDI